jgi:uncharacterized protein involved in exopolysaccharide biosynthesis
MPLDGQCLWIGWVPSLLAVQAKLIQESLAIIRLVIRRTCMEEGIDLRQFIRMLIKYRWLIVGGTVLAVLAAFVVSSLSTTHSYEAVAGVLIAQTRSRITFDTRFQTVESDLTSSYYAAMNQQSRRQALVALVTNGAVATQVAERLEEELGTGKQNPAILLEMVSGEVKSTGMGSQAQANNDLIEIRVGSDSPTKAAWIANAWAEAYVAYVNELYRKGPESYTSVLRQVVATQENYEQSELALTIFVAESRIDELERRITAVTGTLDIQVEDGLETLASHYETKRKMEGLLGDARSLYAHVQKGGEDGAATNGLAILMLKAEAFSTSANLPGELQLQLETASGINAGASAQEADVAALIGVLENRIAELAQMIDQEVAVLLDGAAYEYLSSSVPLTDKLSVAMRELYLERLEPGRLTFLDRVTAPDNLSAAAAAREAKVPLQPEELETLPDYKATAALYTQTIDRLQEELRRLEAELAREQAMEKELIRARDLAWETYSTLRLKESELGVATEMADIEVRFASPAVEPIRSAGPGALPTMGIAAILGLLLSIGTVFVLHYAASGPDSSAETGALLKRPQDAD